MRLFPIIILISLVSCSKEIIITEAEIKPDIFYDKEDLKPFTGKCMVLFPDTDLVKQEFHFKKGRLNGEVFAWYKNGKIQWKGYYVKGFITGKWEFWNENGNKVMEAFYEKDTLNGSYVTWYPSGTVKERGQYANNIRTGKWLKYSDNGQLLAEQVY
jgi:antitoxin component YwqK of YwqJK toxin-antitoxin module